MTVAQQNSVTGRLTFRTKGRTKREETVVDASVGRVPRVARLMALAIRMSRMLETGEVSSQKELAAIAHVTPARLTQILNLCHLAPDIQEEILHTPLILAGRDVIGERQLRILTSALGWEEQRTAMNKLRTQESWRS